MMTLHQVPPAMAYTQEYPLFCRLRTPGEMALALLLAAVALLCAPALRGTRKKPP